MGQRARERDRERSSVELEEQRELLRCVDELKRGRKITTKSRITPYDAVTDKFTELQRSVSW